MSIQVLKPENVFLNTSMTDKITQNINLLTKFKLYHSLVLYCYNRELASHDQARASTVNKPQTVEFYTCKVFILGQYILIKL